MDKKRELMLEKRLEDISIAAIPKPEKETVIKLKPRPPTGKELSLTPEEANMRDLAYEARLATISNNAVVQKLGWKPSKIRSDVTKEMLADYQFEMQKNVKNGVYIPAGLDMDLIPAIADVYIEPEEDYMAERTRISNIISNLNKSYDIISRRLIRISDPYFVFENFNPRDPEEFNRETEALKGDLQQIGTLISQGEAELDRMAAARELSLQRERDRSSEQSFIDQQNALKKRTFTDQVKLLNSGRMDIEMLPGEDEAAYKARLLQVGATTPNQDAVDDAAKLFYTDALREKLQEVFVNDAEALTFIKGLSGEQRYQIVKNFPAFKKEIQDKFGTSKITAEMASRSGNSMHDTLREIKAVLIDALDEKEEARKSVRIEDAIENPALDVVDVSGPAELRQIVNIAFRAQKITDGQRNNLLAYIDNSGVAEYAATKKTSPEKIARYATLRETVAQYHSKAPAAPRGPAFPMPPTGDTARARFNELIGNIRRRMDEIETADPERKDAALQGDYETLDRLFQAGSLPELERAAAASGVSLDEFERRGAGLKRRHAKIAQFGRVDIHPQRLFYDNVLKVTKNGRSITGLTNTKVSDAFASVVMSVISNKTPTLKDFTKMSADEKKLYDTLVIASGLQKDLETVGSGVKEDLKRRLALIEGEVEAGNTNPLLIKEARSVLHRMAQMKMVSRPKAVAHLKQLQSFH